MRKPKTMKVHPYFQHLLRHNMEYLPNLPPFKPKQGLPTDELLDVPLCGTPKSWQKEMERQGLDPVEKSNNEVVDFMEQIEATEDFDHDAKPAAKKTNNGKGNNGNNGKKPNNHKKAPNGDKCCLLHGKGGNSTDECCALQEQTKRLKTKKDGNSSKKSYSKQSGIKTWSLKAKDEETSTKADLAAFVKKEVKKGAQLYAKKRKSDKSSDDDLNAFDLKDFDYDQMDNLKIDSEDEFSV